LAVEERGELKSLHAIPCEVAASHYCTGYTYLVEKERAPESVAVFTYERSILRYTKGFSPIFITAALSVLAFLAIAGWEITRTTQAHNTNPPLVSDVSGTPFSASSISALLATSTDPAAAGATSTDSLSTLGNAVMDQLAGAYTQMQRSGTYSSSTAAAAGNSLAPYLAAGVSYQTFSASQLKVDSDISYARMLQYRSDLRAAFAPLLQNTEPEYEIFAYYVNTKDVSYLAKLKTVAGSYREAANLTAKVVVPQDALEVHIGILNAMEEFASTLDAMAAHANDPFASAALLSGYNRAESDMLSSFNALTIYYKGKTP
jgi:hypothetical protein